MDIITGVFPGIASSPAMRHLLQQMEKIARLPRPVLIRGERGTGKEMVARHLHDLSPRAGRAFVALNCAAFNDELLGSEIYGHEKGAFTGADRKYSGKLEQADGGTLFLDEVGNMSPAFQERILRVVEYQQFQRLKGSETIKVDVRIVSATNAVMEDLMQEGAFRADLFDRLAFATLELPPLRKRREEIPQLVEYFVASLKEEIPNLEAARFGPTAMKRLQEYHWPGNIRELRNVVERCCCYSLDQVITVEDLPAEIAGSRMPAESGYEEQVTEFKRQLLERALEESGGNQKEAAQRLRLSYDQFRHQIRTHLRGG
jgi:DNA-binding NtrC family response regulator